jgi:hypothetical protein
MIKQLPFYWEKTRVEVHPADVVVKEMILSSPIGHLHLQSFVLFPFAHTIKGLHRMFQQNSKTQPT